MTREEAQELLPVIQAFAEGKTIQSRAFKDGYWYDVDGTNDIDWDAHEYRVKPELMYRPFENADECWAEMQKHQPFGWLVSRSTNVRFFVTAIDGKKLCSGQWVSYSRALEMFYFVDGTPFGILEESEG